jgi:hypothetical protein
MMLACWLLLRAPIHLLFPSYTCFEQKTGPPLTSRDCRLRYWLCLSLASSAQLRGGLRSLYSLASGLLSLCRKLLSQKEQYWRITQLYDFQQFSTSAFLAC